ncbi:flagellar hook-basal body complex protein FliE [Paenibacillus septentrionalis]|uniref:Flagellar hook-basal body complex protein FliE n=1 Tax=Paenibacillus septentrionalis TaxID=429342 RepID=A0ABW1V0C3_9BACL
MIEPISTNAINALKTIQPTNNASQKTTAEITKSFGAYLNDALSNVAAQEAEVHKKNDLYLAGQVDATEVLIAANQSQLSLQLTSEIRNKVVAAYQEIMRIQI